MLAPDPSGASAGGIAGAATVVWIALLLGLYIWYAWGLSRAFPKLGVPSHKAWIPVVNEAEILKLGGYAAWNAVFYFLPVIVLYALYLRVRSTHRINAQFGKGAGTTVLAMVAAPVWATLLAAGRVHTPTPLVERIASTMTTPNGPEHGTSQSEAASSPLPSRPAAASEPTFPRAPYAVQPFPADEHPEDEELRVTAVRRALPEVFPWEAHLAPDVKEDLEPDRVPDLEPDRVPELEPDVVPELESEAPVDEPKAPLAPWAPTVAAVEPPDQDDPAASEEPATGQVQPAPVEIPAPPAALPPEMNLSAAAVSALVASVREPFDYDASEDAKYDDDGVTIVVDRKPPVRWFLSVDGASDLPLTAEHVLLGRKPATTTAGTQALAVPDPTRTLSKLHARLDLVDESWTITDLNSTNGVLLVDNDGTETLIEPGSTVAITGHFVLGKVGMSIREGESA